MTRMFPGLVELLSTMIFSSIVVGIALGLVLKGIVNHYQALNGKITIHSKAA